MNQRSVFANVYEQRGKKEGDKKEAFGMELLFREAAKAQIAVFVWHHEEGFFELYRDTGLWSEEMIVESVRANGRKLFDDLYNGIESRLCRDPVLGRKKLKKKWLELDFYVGSRLIIVHYSEDRRENIRWIESISIDKKPIIF